MLDKINTVLISQSLLQEIYSHCDRKLASQWGENETHENQAFGLLGGYIEEHQAHIEDFIILKENFRTNKKYQLQFTSLINQFATGGGLSIEKRGWISSPKETLQAMLTFEKASMSFLGGYHLHHEGSWKNGPSKQNCSELDKKLGEGTDELMFIVSVIDKGRAFKCFYEGDVEREIKVIIKEDKISD